MDLLKNIDSGFWILAKVAVLIFLAVYSIFSYIVVKQAKLMAETLEVDFDRLIVVYAYILLAASLIVFVTAAVFL